MDSRCDEDKFKRDPGGGSGDGKERAPKQNHILFGKSENNLKGSQR